MPSICPHLQSIIPQMWMPDQVGRVEGSGRRYIKIKADAKSAYTSHPIILSGFIKGGLTSSRSRIWYKTYPSRLFLHCTLRRLFPGEILNPCQFTQIELLLLPMRVPRDIRSRALTRLLLSHPSERPDQRWSGIKFEQVNRGLSQINNNLPANAQLCLQTTVSIQVQGRESVSVLLWA